MHKTIKPTTWVFVPFAIVCFCLSKTEGQNNGQKSQEGSLGSSKISLQSLRESIRKKQLESAPNQPKGPMGMDTSFQAAGYGGSASQIDRYGGGEGGMSGPVLGGMPGMSTGMGMPGAGDMSSYGVMSAGGEMGMGAGMSMGMEGGFANQPTEKQQLLWMIQQLSQRLGTKSADRDDSEKLLRRALQQYFEADMEERVREFDNIKARVAEMESRLERRIERQNELIELQMKRMLHKADGLDFYVPTSNPNAVSPGGELGSMATYSPYDTRPIHHVGYDAAYGLTRLHRLNSTSLSESDPLKAYFQYKKDFAFEQTNSGKLKAILLALHEFHERFQHFPNVANRHAKDQPPHSWQIAILPLVGRSDLYRAYHFDEAWDSENNRRLIDQMPDVFKTEDSGPGQTHILMSCGATAFAQPGQLTRIADIFDGTSNTIAIIHAKEPRVWTQPIEMMSTFSPSQLASDRLVGMADGVIVELSNDLVESDFLAMITRGGGELFSVENVTVKRDRKAK